MGRNLPMVNDCSWPISACRHHQLLADLCLPWPAETDPKRTSVAGNASAMFKAEQGALMQNGW